MSDLPFETHINDMPSEVIEKISQWLQLKSINNFMSVNTYIHSVINHSTIWKRYLYYPERYYKSDLHSCSSTPLVAEVVAKILAGRLGKWRGFFMLQQVRMDSLHASTNISIDPFANISLSNRSLLHMSEMVDDHDERWLFVQSNDNKIQVWNVTDNIKALTPQALMSNQGNGRWEVLELLPQGKVLLREPDELRYIVHVYQFESPDYNMNLQFKFVYNMDAILSSSIQIPENEVGKKGEIDRFAYAILGTTFISCKSWGSLPELQLLTLHIWNLNSGIKTEKIPLGPSVAVIEFLKRVKHLDSLSSQCQDNKFIVILHPGSTSNVLVIVFKYGHSKQVNVFDLKTKVFTFMEYWKMEMEYYYPDVPYCHVFGDKLCVADPYVDSDQPWIKVMSYLTVYSTKIPKHTSQTPTPHHLTTLSTVKGEYTSRKHGDFRIMDNIITFKQSKALVQYDNTVTIVDLNTMQETKVTIYPYLPDDPLEEMALGCIILAFVEPKYLLVYNSAWNDRALDEGLRNRVWMGNIKMINVERNTELYMWKDISLSENVISYYNKLQYPSRIAVQYEDNLQLFIK